jgi:hypothetical protein
LIYSGQNFFKEKQAEPLRPKEQNDKHHEDRGQSRAENIKAGGAQKGRPEGQADHSARIEQEENPQGDEGPKQAIKQWLPSLCQRGARRARQPFLMFIPATSSP